LFLAEKQQGRGDTVPVSSVRAGKRISTVAKRSKPDLCSAQSPFSARKD